MTKGGIDHGVVECLALALGLDTESIAMDASIMSELGADSVDMIDALFRIDKQFGTTTSMWEIEERMRCGLSDEEFYDENRKVTAAGMKRLLEAFPETNLSEVAELDELGLFSLITVQHLADLIREKVGES